MAGLCDKCGERYFVSCHDCMHKLTMVFHSCKKLLALLPAGEYPEERAELLSLKNFYEDKIIANTEKAKED